MGHKYKTNREGYTITNIDSGSTFKNEIGPSAVGDERIIMADHYNGVLKEAKRNGETILRSNAESDVPKSELIEGYHPFRDEHGQYTYYALPNWAKNTVKHILPYDMRTPRNWSDPNIFRAAVPVGLGIGGASLIDWKRDNNPQPTLKRGGVIKVQK